MNFRWKTTAWNWKVSKYVANAVPDQLRAGDSAAYTGLFSTFSESECFFVPSINSCFVSYNVEFSESATRRHRLFRPSHCPLFFLVRSLCTNYEIYIFAFKIYNHLFFIYFSKLYNEREFMFV